MESTAEAISTVAFGARVRLFELATANRRGVLLLGLDSTPGTYRRRPGSPYYWGRIRP